MLKLARVPGFSVPICGIAIMAAGTSVSAAKALASLKP